MATTPLHLLFLPSLPPFHSRARATLAKVTVCPFRPISTLANFSTLVRRGVGRRCPANKCQPFTGLVLNGAVQGRSGVGAISFAFLFFPYMSLCFSSCGVFSWNRGGVSRPYPLPLPLPLPSQKIRTCGLILCEPQWLVWVWLKNSQEDDRRDPKSATGLS